MATLLRRRKLGLTSCREISGMSQQNLGFIRNDKPWPTGEDVCIRWGTTSNVPNGVKVVNSAAAIHRVSDKRGFRNLLNSHELCPETWMHYNDVPDNAYPVVFRPATHAQGRHVYLCNNYNEMHDAHHSIGRGDYYISEYIPKVAEFRVLVMQGRVVWVAEKTPSNPDDVAWNVAKGGRFDNVKWDAWNANVIQNALDSWELSKLHFGGVDVMLDAEGNAYCVEINSAPSQTSPYRQSCMAKAFDYMVENNKYGVREFERQSIRRGWRGTIHPAVTTATRGVG